MRTLRWREGGGDAEEQKSSPRTARFRIFPHIDLPRGPTSRFCLPGTQWSAGCSLRVLWLILRFSQAGVDFRPWLRYIAFPLISQGSAASRTRWLQLGIECFSRPRTVTIRLWERVLLDSYFTPRECSAGITEGVIFIFIYLLFPLWRIPVCMT